MPGAAGAPEGNEERSEQAKPAHEPVLSAVSPLTQELTRYLRQNINER